MKKQVSGLQMRYVIATNMKPENIKIRRWDLSDAPQLAEFANNKKIADNLRDGFPYPYTIKDAHNFIQAALKNDLSASLFAIDLGGIALGSIGAMFKDDVYRLNVEIGYWLAEEYWGKGITVRAIRLIVKYIFDNFDTVRIYAEPFADNVASQRTLEKAGFRKEAYFKKNIVKNDIIKDSMIYALLREEYSNYQANRLMSDRS